MQQVPSFSFTTVNPDRVNVLRNECSVSEAWDPSSDDPEPQICPFVAIWDTGATNSVISPKVVAACGLRSIGVQRVSYANGTANNVEAFLVNIRLPNNVGFSALRVTLGELGDADMLIGMDIINQGDFAVTNSNNRTKFSFRIPSQADIDFVAEDRRRKAQRGHAIPSEHTRQRQRRKRNRSK